MAQLSTKQVTGGTLPIAGVVQDYYIGPSGIREDLVARSAEGINVWMKQEADSTTATDPRVDQLILDVAALEKIPAQICRTNATRNVAPTTVELNGVTPNANDITEVLLSDGTREIWQFGGPWAVKETYEPGGNSAGLGGFAVSQTNNCVATITGTTTAGAASTASFFNNPSRDVIVVDGRAAWLSGDCPQDCDLILDVADMTYWNHTGGSLSTSAAPQVARFFGTMSPRQFVKAYEAAGNTYCNNYHQCYLHGNVCEYICVIRPLTGEYHITATIDNGSQYTIEYEIDNNGTPQTVNTTHNSGEAAVLNLTDFTGKITICADPDGDDFDYSVGPDPYTIPLPDAQAVCG